MAELSDKHITQDYNEEAEAAVVRGCLMDDPFGEIALNVSEITNPLHFSTGFNRTVFGAIQSLLVSGQPLDFLHLTTELTETKKLDGLGGPGAIFQIYEPLHAGEYVIPESVISAAEMVRDSYTNRTINKHAQIEFQKLIMSNGDKLAAVKTYVNRAKELEKFVSQKMGDFSPWQPKPLKISMQPRPPREYVVNGILSAPSLSIWYGSPGSLKTMVLLDLALSVATGTPWLPARPGGQPVASFSTSPAPVLWLDQDSGEDEIDRRITAIAKTKPFDNQTPFYSLSFPMPAFLADDPTALQMLIDHASKIEAKLIIIDCLNAITGNADENSPEMATVMHGLRQLAERTRAAVIVIHHPNKADDKILRGHSSINGAVDLAMSIRRDSPAAPDITFESTKTRQTPITPFGAYFAYTQQKGSSNELETACFFGTGKPELNMADTSKFEAAKHWIKKIAPHKMKQSKIVSTVAGYGPGRNTTLAALNEMINNNELTIETGPNNAKLYSMPVTSANQFY